MPRTFKTKVKGLPTRLTQADRLMKNQVFPEAIALYIEHLSTAPTDLAALLKLGLCHLLNRSENQFLGIFRSAGKQIEFAPDQPSEVRALWTKYQGLVVKVTAGALVVGGLSMAGCASHGNSSDKPSTPTATAVEPDMNMPGLTPPIQSPDNFPITAHKYSGGIYLQNEFRPPLLIEEEQEPGLLDEKKNTGNEQK